MIIFDELELCRDFFGLFISPIVNTSLFRGYFLPNLRLTSSLKYLENLKQNKELILKYSGPLSSFHDLPHLRPSS